MSARTILAKSCRVFFNTYLSKKDKSLLRDQALKAAISDEYPFDAEAKFLLSTGVETPMLDIGANTGVYSSLLEETVGSKNLVLIEPLPHLAKYLRRRFNKCRVMEIAVSNREGRETIRIPSIDGSQYSTRATLNSHTEPNQTGFESIEVSLKRLDVIADDLGLSSLGFVKIDVEVHELEVIQGGIETFKRFKPLILIEVESRHHDFPISVIFHKISELGYKGYFMDPIQFRLLRTEDFEPTQHQNLHDLERRNFVRYLNNFFFVPPEKESRFLTLATAFLASESSLSRATTCDWP